MKQYSEPTWTSFSKISSIFHVYYERDFVKFVIIEDDPLYLSNNDSQVLHQFPQSENQRKWALLEPTLTHSTYAASEYSSQARRTVLHFSAVTIYYIKTFNGRNSTRFHTKSVQFMQP